MNNSLAINDFTGNKVSNFYYSFLFLPKPKRDAINLVYAWCRATDDIVDSNNSIVTKESKLITWANEFEKGLFGNSSYQIINKLGEIILKFNIPVEHFRNLIDGMKMDLTKNRYETFEELLDYCYKVASTVGLISAEIFSYKNKTTLEYAKNLGFALQLTNILRDVKSDILKDRIYLPLEDLKKFNICEEEIKENVFSQNFKNLMIFEANRTEDYFKNALKNIKSEDKIFFVAAEIMRKTYLEILYLIKKNDYDVFKNKNKLTTSKKISIALNTWIEIKK